jgi:hypothetical protein
MISSISSSGMQQINFRSESSSKLTEDQKTKLEEILAKYDPENMTDESAKAMMDEIKAAGIGPSREFGQIMNEAGFKPPEKPEGPPPQDSAGGVQKEMPDFMIDFMKKQEAGEVTDADIYSLIQNLLSTDKSTTGSIIDQKV